MFINITMKTGSGGACSNKTVFIVSPLTVTLYEQDALLPDLSDTVKLTVESPIGNSISDVPHAVALHL